MQKEKTLDAINSAIRHLDESIRAFAKNNNEKTIMDSLWLASSETEYTIFLFSLLHPEKSEGYALKHSSQRKETVEVGSTLVSAQNFLKDAKNDIETGIIEKAYEKLWNARSSLLKVQEFLEKKQKGAGSAS